MPNGDTAFWLALLSYPCSQERRARLWNGYIGWKPPRVLRRAVDLPQVVFERLDPETHVGCVP